MGSFPEIDRPCPYADRLDSVIEGGFCSMCKCTVFDLDAMAPRERRSFLKGREGETCVTYRIKPALAAMAMVAAMGVASSALAQDAQPAEDEEIVMAGGIRPARPVAAPVPVEVIRPQDARPKRERKRRKPRQAAAAPSEPEIIIVAGRVAQPRTN